MYILLAVCMAESSLAYASNIVGEFGYVDVSFTASWKLIFTP